MKSAGPRSASTKVRVEHISTKVLFVVDVSIYDLTNVETVIDHISPAACMGDDTGKSQFGIVAAIECQEEHRRSAETIGVNRFGWIATIRNHWPPIFRIQQCRPVQLQIQSHETRRHPN
jgi:hypothetical protein